MEHIRIHFERIYKSQPGLISLAAIENPYPYDLVTQDFMLLVIVEEGSAAEGTEHVQVDEENVVVHTLKPASLEKWLSSQDSRNIIQWLVRGEILVDREGYLEHLREQIEEFPTEMRQQKLFIEYAGFVKTYIQAKQELLDNHLLDAHGSVLAALNHMAHIALIEDGQHPELTVWRQMRRFHPGIYKLYEELTVSPETLEQRIQLVMLACDFAIMNSMKSCCLLLLQLMSNREEPWGITELKNHRYFCDLEVDLTLIMEKLVKRNYVREIAVLSNGQDTCYVELRYQVLN